MELVAKFLRIIPSMQVTVWFAAAADLIWERKMRQTHFRNFKYSGSKKEELKMSSNLYVTVIHHNKR